MSVDPVHYENGVWYFWDETWTDRVGPFISQEEARQEMDRYCREVLGIPDQCNNCGEPLFIGEEHECLAKGSV